MKTAFVRDSLSLQTLFALLVVVMLAACSQQEKSTYVTVEQEGGPTLGYSPQSGVKVLTIDGLKFKDLNRNDSLDGYEDWRLSSQQRAADLASKLSIEEIAGLMLYSAHQAIPMSFSRTTTCVPCSSPSWRALPMPPDGTITCKPL